MLELPEAVVISRQLDETVRGKTIAAVEAGHSPHGFAWYFGDPASYPPLLCGQTVGAVYPLGGRIEIAAGDARISFNDGVNVRLFAPGEPEPAKHQFLLRFDDGSAIYCTVQMYGGMLAFPAGALDSDYYYTAARDKPSPLTAAFDTAYFESLARDGGPKISAKALLATEQRIPGLGNGCLQDILWHARIHPQTKIGALDSAQLEALFQSVKTTLLQMTERGGRDTEKDLFGRPGGYQTVLSNKTMPFACPACGGSITRKAYMGGNVYFCAHCQPSPVGKGS